MSKGLDVELVGACDVDIRKDLYNNIVVSGGASLLAGLPERLSKEMAALVPSLTPSHAPTTSPRQLRR